MKEPLPAADMIRAAANLIKRTLRLLDTSQSVCQHCGMKRYNNMSQGRVHERLNQLPRKLFVLATWLDDDAPPRLTDGDAERSQDKTEKNEYDGKQDY